MPPEEFVGVDVVLEVGVRRAPNGITLILSHLSRPNALRHQEPETTAFLMTLGQADQLFALLAQMLQAVRRDRKSDM